MKNKRQNSGFTIVEVLITVAIIAIIAAVALPSYQQYLIKTRRVDAANALLKIHAEQEKYYFENNTYMSDAVFRTQNTARSWLPDYPTTSSSYYTIAIAANGGTLQDGFVATATPTGIQANDTDCTSISLNSNGQRTATGADVDDCWR